MDDENTPENPTTGADVLDINSNKGKNKSKKKTKKETENPPNPPTPAPPTPKKPAMAEIQQAIIRAFNRDFLSSLPEPRAHFGIFADRRRKKVPFGIGSDGLCYDMGLDHVADEIGSYCYNELLGRPHYQILDSSIEACAKLWKKITPLVEQPKPFIFANEEGLAYARLPFELKCGPAPLFDEMFGRMTNAVAVKCWIGSLLVENSYRQQYVWLYGGGNDGKGSLLRFLFKFFGAAAQIQGMLPDPTKNKHCWVPYANARLIIFTDLDDYSGITKGGFKALTGDDPVFVDPKWEGGWSTNLTCKPLIASNEMPNLTAANSDQRRIIFAQMSEALEDDAEYEDKLWLEGGAFMANCLELFKSKYPKFGRIKADDDQDNNDTLAGWASTIEEEFQVFFERHFTLSDRHYVWPKDMQLRLDIGFDKRGSRLAFVKWLMTRHKIRKKSDRGTQEYNGEPKEVYRGLKLIPLPRLP